MSEEIELMLLADVKSLEVENKRLIEENSRLRQRYDRLREVLDVLVYWHDHATFIDESWWDEARKVLSER
jgi:regulator of replication initiation timing